MRAVNGNQQKDMKMRALMTGAAIAALCATAAHAEPREVKVNPPVCGTGTVAKVPPGCAKSEAMGEGIRADGDAGGCPDKFAGGIDYTTAACAAERSQRKRGGRP